MDNNILEDILRDHYDEIQILKQLTTDFKSEVNFGVWLDTNKYPEAKIPVKANETDAGFDIHSAEAYYLEPTERALINTGVYLELQPGWECQVRPRSGLALKKGITVLNAPGTIDADYRGEVCVILLNTSEEGFEINVGDRIAQLVFSRVPQVKLTILSEKPELTKRGEAGFGSTGVSQKL
jgi:dUTP pyrophosphatase